MKRLIVALAFAAAAGIAAPTSQTLQDTASKTRAHVETLASDRFAGRLAGSPGEQLAAAYLAAQLQRIGAKPLPGHEYQLPFEFTAGARDRGSSVSTSRTGTGGGAGAGFGEAARALSFSDDGDVTAPVVFAGYGIVVPDSQDFGYD